MCSFPFGTKEATSQKVGQRIWLENWSCGLFFVRSGSIKLLPSLWSENVELWKQVVNNIASSKFTRNVQKFHITFEQNHSKISRENTIFASAEIKSGWIVYIFAVPVICMKLCEIYNELKSTSTNVNGDVCV